jgi:phosphatidylserine/phosphatidylglycerophosphate/cardiolipin synthase-like enzyme
MHEKKIITPELTLVGSYNLTFQARVYNSESIYCIATTDQDTSRFDAEWASLADRVIDIFSPDQKLFTKAPSRKRKASADGEKT